MINEIEKEIKEIKEIINHKLDSLITEQVESDYIRSYVELLKIQAILLIKTSMEDNKK